MHTGKSAKEDVGAGVAEGEFLFRFDAQGAFAGAGDWVFGDEGPVELAGAALEEVAEGFADVAFVVEVGAAEFGEGFIVGLDGGVVGF